MVCVRCAADCSACAHYLLPTPRAHSKRGEKVNKSGTVKMKKGSKAAKLRSFRKTFKDSLCNGISMKLAVALPKGHDRNDWIVMNSEAALC